MKTSSVRLAALLALSLNMAQAASLVGYAELKADTFAPGPASGAWNGGLRGAARFGSQPVQGFSGVQFDPSGSGFVFLSDNGFGARNNSADYLLRLHRVALAPGTPAARLGQVSLGGVIELRDPDRKVPWQIVNESTSGRLLTGADFDLEGFAFAPDGTLWVGDEFGPYLLHFSADGRLLEAPVATPNLAGLPTLRGQRPLVVAHRGSSGTRPEHTLEAYRVAIEAGADFIEPDLVVTRDGVLVARHEPVIAVLSADGKVTEATADVAARPEFKDRARIKKLDGKDVYGYWAEDFTLAELKTLRAVERLPQLRGRAYDGRFEIPTLAEIIALVRDVEARTGRRIGIYPETKHPTFVAQSARMNISQLLIDTLKKENFTDPARVFIQSFEVGNLKELKTRIMPAAGVNLPLVQLISSPDEAPYDWAAAGDLRTYGALTSDAALKEIAGYAAGVGPYKRWIIDDQGRTTDFVSRAHATGLLVHPWTFRNEPTYLLPGYQNDPEAELRQALRAGVDGFFSDFPATGARVVSQYSAPEVRSPQHHAYAQGDSSSAANLPASGGFEGLNLSPDGRSLYALLEKTVAGDLPGQLRLMQFDLTSRKWALAGRYALEPAGEAIGDLAPVNDHEYLVLERDNASGGAAKFKRVYLLNLREKNPDGTLKKTLVADLMNLRDPQKLAPSTVGGVFSFPYVTIENVLVLDAQTILVANDNNFPATGGRGREVRDVSEFLWIRLDQPLKLAAGVGQRPAARN
ncbi:esterase-like activity of phytase family protein [Deinococcus deserti]|uniref:glycerophosphodiester phosphodiesterase n=1 Tax=Deinococcus deserti (strain DSM 17065 / CIP 109153 / LMG 22923 / VCD115) TaxID=546414 RepID=C1CYJ7_DEIDV|nr:esterase-like activity of phytase family protein [Deinococcus deserti]ACO45018.1 putative Glycerophosphoryl diester phosphodiesterase [Deinococcus deserti VCD115]